MLELADVRPAEPRARAALVVARTRALYKKAAPRLESLDLDELIAEMRVLMPTEVLTNAIHLQLELASSPARVMADRIQLQQVLDNLFRNAIEAMSTVTDRPRELRVRTRRDPVDGVVVEVSDRGHGLDAGRDVFESFHTTKPLGMGMGLAICRSIIEFHGGRIWARPNDDHGATLCFALPIGPDPIEA
jgi:signal transduction histidine kinase